jgi:hypothetical protein
VKGITQVRINRSLRALLRNRENARSFKVEKSSFSIKEWVGIITSFVAFVLSLYTFYSSNLRKVDDFRLSLQGVMSGFNMGEEFAIGSELSGTFINSGTRSVAVENVSLLVTQHEVFTGDLIKDCYGGQELYRVMLEPFVVKPQEIAIRPLKKYEPQLNHKFAPDGSPILAFTDAKASVHPLVICLLVIFVLPEHAQQVRQVLLMAENWPSTSKFTPASPAGYRYLNQPPSILLQESRFSLFTH